MHDHSDGSWTLTRFESRVVIRWCGRCRSWFLVRDLEDWGSPSGIGPATRYTKTYSVNSGDDVVEDALRVMQEMLLELQEMEEDHLDHQEFLMNLPD